jgi:cytochrome b pre-mRNA-processing protein 3
MIFHKLFGRKNSQTKALYDQIVAAARQPNFFEQFEIPDTLDGRFDALVLHLFLVLHRLKAEPEKTKQDLIDYFFLDMDRNLREMGVGDVSVGKKVRKMAEAFYGRSLAYTAGLEQGENALNTVLQRNIYAGVENPKSKNLAKWVRAANISLQNQAAIDVLNAKVSFR